MIVKKQVNALIKEKRKLQDKLKKIDTAIESLRDVCDHKYENGKSAMECIGHDSHDNHYECQICGKMEYY